MEPFYVCRRAFRGPHGPIVVGAIVDARDLRRYKYRLQEKHIVRVTEQNFEQYVTLFKEKYGIDLVKPVQTDDALLNSLKARMEAIPRHIALKYFFFPEDLATPISTVIEAVEQAEKAKAEEEAKAKAEEEAKAKAEEETKAKAEEEAKAKAEEEAKAKPEDALRAKLEAAKVKATPVVAAKAVTKVN
jgi:colicin import membrane protein